MITIEALVNKIKWDKRENPKDYSLFYIDRITRKQTEIRFPDIKRVEEGIMILDRDGEETQIPLHRIREAKKKGTTVWKR